MRGQIVGLAFLTSCCASAQTTFQPIVPTFELISSSNTYGTGSISITLPGGTSSSEVLAQNSASVMLVTGEAWANQASVEKKGQCKPGLRDFCSHQRSRPELSGCRSGCSIADYPADRLEHSRSRNILQLHLRCLLRLRAGHSAKRHAPDARFQPPHKS